MADKVEESAVDKSPATDSAEVPATDSAEVPAVESEPKSTEPSAASDEGEAGASSTDDSPKTKLPLSARILAAVVGQFDKEAFSYIAHSAALVLLLVVLRPFFTSPVPAAVYEAKSVVWGMIDYDISLLMRAAQRRTPAAPLFLFMVLPTVVFWAAGRKLRWTDWKHGKALRNVTMAVLFMLAWSGSTFDYNLYIDKLHLFDRLLLVAFAALAWHTPLAVPFVTRLAIVMIRQSYVPVPHDDFDYRPAAEIMVVLSVFSWAAFKKSFKPKHYLLIGVGAWACYYYTAGVAKLNYGGQLSWYYDNHVSNFAVSAHARGWLGFVRDDVITGIVAQLHRFDKPMAAFTLVVELGALVAFYLHPKLTKLWFVLCLTLHLGIFALTGVFFWKWMVVNFVFAWWIHRGGEPLVREMTRYKLVALFGIATVFYSANRIWYFPQIGVVWYDSRFMDDFELHAVGASGKRYLVDPNLFAPSDMHWVQGSLCYLTKERVISGIYGTMGNRRIMLALEKAKSADDALRLVRRGGRCTSRRQVDYKKRGEKFLKRFFRNANRHGKRPHAWLGWIGRPTHLLVQPQGLIYDYQEPVVKVELWREMTFHHDGQLKRWPRKLVHTLAIPK